MKIRTIEKPAKIVEKWYGCEQCEFESRDEQEVYRHTAILHAPKARQHFVGVGEALYFADKESFKLHERYAHPGWHGNVNRWSGPGWYVPETFDDGDGYYYVEYRVLSCEPGNLRQKATSLREEADKIEAEATRIEEFLKEHGTL